MKKSLLALAVVAGFSGVAQADNTTLYGRLAYKVDFSGGEKAKDAVNVFKNNLDLKTSGVRLGVKGLEDLNNGLKVHYQLEFDFGFGGDHKGTLKEVRQANLGFSGSFGKVTLGKQTNLHGHWAGKADQMNSVSGAFADSLGSRSAKAISFVSPATGGVTAGAAVVLDGSGEVHKLGTSKNVRIYQAGLNYAVNGLEASFVYTATKGDKPGVKHGSDELFAAGVSYGNDTFLVGADYWHTASTGDYIAVAGQYYMGQNTFSADFEYANPKGAKNELMKVGLGYQYKLSKRTRAWVEGSYTRDKYEFKGKKSQYSAVVGVRHDF